MKTNVLTLAIALTVGVILAGSLLMPVISDATETERTLTNDGYFRMSNTSDETVIKWTPSVDPYTFEINGEDYTVSGLNSTVGGSYSIAFADDFILRYFYNGPSSINLQYWAGGYRGGASFSLTGTAIFTINSSTTTYTTDAPDATVSSYTHTGDYFVIDPAGDYIMKNKSTPAYIKGEDSVYYGAGLSAMSGPTLSSLYLEGTIDSITVSPMSTSCAVSNENITYSEVKEYVDLYALEKITFTTTWTPQSGDPTDADQTYSYFAVPYQVTVELSQHLTNGEIAIMNALPVLIIAALVVMAAGAIFLKRED